MATSEQPQSHDLYSFSIYQLARYVSHLEEEYERDVIPIVYFRNASSKSKALLKYLDFLTYYFKLDEKDWEVYQDYKKAQNQAEVIDMISTIFEEKGKIKGKLEEGRDTLLWLYSQKLGPIPMEIEQAIRALNDVNRIHDIRSRFMEINSWQQLKQCLN